MDRRKLTTTAALGAALGVGALIGAVVFSPAVGLADPVNDDAVAICADALGAGPVAEAAEAIGIEPSELLAELRGGRTIAEVAEANGVEVDAVIDAVVAALQERLDDAVENGWLTQEEADDRAAELEEEATDLVNGELPPLPPLPPLPGFPGRGWDRHGPLGRPWLDLDPDTNPAELST